ncbi:MAG TPA: TetR/AcrR family transcriptional regulator [Noviherbaspirillum sp.]|nr:TetR/AcrR family transcriptional regulator [Noviherbaspirillum sp.]
MNERTLSKSELTREAFLDTALQEASMTGIARLTLAPLAAAAGRSKGGLLRYFPSKESLRIAVLDHAFRRFRELILVPAQAAPAGLPRLRATLELWLTWIDRAGLQGGCPLLCAQQEFDDEQNQVREHLRQATAEWNNYLVHQARKAADAGQLPAGLAPEAVVMVMQGLVSAAQMERRLLGRKQVNARAMQAFDQLTQPQP